MLSGLLMELDDHNFQPGAQAPGHRGPHPLQPFFTAAGNRVGFAPAELPDWRQVRVERLYPKTVLKPAVRTMLVPVPKTAPIGGQPLRDADLLAWCGEVIRSVLADL